MAKGQEVNRSELAALFGVSLPTITNWVKKGCPYVEKGGNGRAWVFNSADVVRWREELAREEGITSDLDDRTMGQLEKIELEIKVEKARLSLDQAKGKLVALELVQPVWEMMAANIRSKMMGIPNKAQSRIPGFSREHADILKQLIYQGLEEIADDDELPDTVATVVDGGLPDDAAAAAADS